MKYILKRIILYTGHLHLQDDYKIKLGNSDDLNIYHSGGINYIDASSGHFALRGTGNDNILYYTKWGCGNIR